MKLIPWSTGKIPVMLKWILQYIPYNGRKQMGNQGQKPHLLIRGYKLVWNWFLGLACRLWIRVGKIHHSPPKKNSIFGTAILSHRRSFPSADVPQLWMSEVGRPVAHVFLSYAPNACRSGSPSHSRSLRCIFCGFFIQRSVLVFTKWSPNRWEKWRYNPLKKPQAPLIYL